MGITINGTANTIAGLAVGGIPDGTVDRDALAADAVDGTKLADDAVASEHVADDAVGSAAIADDAVVAAAIADDAVVTASIADSAVTAAKASGLGIAEIDQWRMTTEFSGNADPITSNWERVDSYWTKLGTGMSESSGIFTFPSTGYWYIDFKPGCYVTNHANEYTPLIRITTNNSSWDGQGISWNAVGVSDDATVLDGGQVAYIFRVADTTTHKCSFRIYSAGVDGTIYTQGNTSINYTSCNFIKLAGL